MRDIVFEVSDAGIIDCDVSVILDSFNYSNWYRSVKEYNILYSNIDSISIGIAYESIKDFLNTKNGINIEKSAVIPVGSIEFTETMLGRQILSINIPEQLRNAKFTGRYTEYIKKNDIQSRLDKYGELFIKDAKYCKKFEPLVITSIKDIELPDSILVSEVIAIIAEYRVFIHRGQILDCRNYLGSYRNQINYDLVDETVKSWKECPPAYTLDFGVTADGNTMLIEAHNFISCGLYGFAKMDKIPNMIISSYKYEIERRDGE